MILKSSLAFAAATLLILGMATAFRRQRSGTRVLLLLAAACLVVVTLTHVFEALHVFSAAGWGEPQSIGHYIDLTAAIAGLTLVAAAAATALGRPWRK